MVLEFNEIKIGSRNRSSVVANVLPKKLARHVFTLLYQVSRQTCFTALRAGEFLHECFRQRFTKCWRILFQWGSSKLAVLATAY
jgi:hypothetical protein